MFTPKKNLNSRTARAAVSSFEFRSTKLGRVSASEGTTGMDTKPVPVVPPSGLLSNSSQLEEVVLFGSLSLTFFATRHSWFPSKSFSVFLAVGSSDYDRFSG